jgi:hypothetical protein
MSNSSQLTATVATNYMASNLSSNFAGVGYTSTTQAGTTVGATHNTSGLSMAWPQFITTFAAQTVQPVAFSASGGSSAFSTLTFSNLANGVSFSNSAGQVAMSHSLQQLSNTSAITSNAFPSANTTQFAGTGTTYAGTNVSASITLNSAGLNLALSGVGGGVVNQTGPNIAVAGSTITAGTVVFSNSNLLTFGMVGSTITASYGDPSNWRLFGNTAGTTSSTNGTDGIYFSGGNGITLSGNSNTIVVSAAGAAGMTLSFMEPNMLVGTALSSFGQNSLQFVAVKPLANVTMTKMNMLVSLNNSTSSISHAKSQTISYGLYSLGTGTNNTRIESMATSSMALIASYSSNLSGGYTLQQGTNSTTYSSAGTGSTSAWTGQRILAMPFATSISAGGEYYFCVANSTAGIGAVSALLVSHIVLNNMTNGSWGNMGVNGITVSNASVVPSFVGFLYSATSAAWPSTIALSQRSIYSNIRPYIQFEA